MVAVDTNILIGTIVILSIAAYIFILRRMKTKPPSLPTASVLTKMSGGAVATSNKETADCQQLGGSPRAKKPSTECGHHFGYLSNSSRKGKPPKECLECGKITKCKNFRKPKKSRGKQIEAVLAIDEETSAREILT